MPVIECIKCFHLIDISNGHGQPVGIIMLCPTCGYPYGWTGKGAGLISKEGALALSKNKEFLQMMEEVHLRTGRWG